MSARTKPSCAPASPPEPRIPAAGTFRTLAQAEKFVSKAIQANAAQIQSWASSATLQPLRLIYDAGETVGATIPRTTGILQRLFLGSGVLTGASRMVRQ
jgi:hypothetical protein